VSDKTGISWTDATWNVVTGCDRVSPGCAHCYALDLAARLKKMGNSKYQRDGDPRTSGPGFGVTLHPDVLDQPLRWKKPRRVFVNSMSDLFHDDVPFDFIDRVFAVMAIAQRHTFQLLSKRADRMQMYLSDPATSGRVERVIDEMRASRESLVRRAL
jgi:protein gp37